MANSFIPQRESECSILMSASKLVIAKDESPKATHVPFDKEKS